MNQCGLCFPIKMSDSLKSCYDWHYQYHINYFQQLFYVFSLLSQKKERKVKVTKSCLTLCDPMSPCNSPGQNAGVGSLSLLQGIFPTQGLNPGLPYRRCILYQLSRRENSVSHLPQQQLLGGDSHRKLVQFLGYSSNRLSLSTNNTNPSI